MTTNLNLLYSVVPSAGFTLEVTLLYRCFLHAWQHVILNPLMDDRPDEILTQSLKQEGLTFRL